MHIHPNEIFPTFFRALYNYIPFGRNIKKLKPTDSIPNTTKLVILKYT